MEKGGLDHTYPDVVSFILCYLYYRNFWNTGSSICHETLEENEFNK